MNFLQVNEAVFETYAFYAALLALKLILMSPITGLTRITKKAFANPEDAAKFKTKVNPNHPSVERIRRAHLNDLENIPAFWVIGILYVLTNPSVSCAKLCFRIFAAVRITHTIAYLLEIFPVRGACFGVGLFVNMYMVFNVLCHFF